MSHSVARVLSRTPIMQSTTAAKRAKERIVPSRYMQHHSRPADDKENATQPVAQPTTTKPLSSTATLSTHPTTLPTIAMPATPIAHSNSTRASRSALSTLPVPANRAKPAAASVSSFSSTHATASTRCSTLAADKLVAQPANGRRRTHGIAEQPPDSVVSHRSSLPLGTAQPGTISLPTIVRPQLSDLSLHCHQTALLQSLYWQAAVERAHDQRREAAERQLGAVAAVVRSRLSEESQCQQRIARIQQSEADHYSLAAQHAAITPLLPLLQQAATAYEQAADVADALKAQLRLEGVTVKLGELACEVLEARSVLYEIDELLNTASGGPSLASSIAELAPSMSTLLALQRESVPALSGTSIDVAVLQDRVERESSDVLAQIACSSEADRRNKRQQAGGRWQW